MRWKCRNVSLYLGYVCNINCRSMDNGSGFSRIRFSSLRCLCSSDYRHLSVLGKEFRRQCGKTSAIPLSHRDSPSFTLDVFNYPRWRELGGHNGGLKRISSALHRFSRIVHNILRIFLNIPLTVIPCLLCFFQPYL